MCAVKSVLIEKSNRFFCHADYVRDAEMQDFVSDFEELKVARKAAAKQSKYAKLASNKVATAIVDIRALNDDERLDPAKLFSA
jgi:cell division protein FtsL